MQIELGLSDTQMHPNIAWNGTYLCQQIICYLSEVQIEQGLTEMQIYPNSAWCGIYLCYQVICC